MAEKSSGKGSRGRGWRFPLCFGLIAGMAVPLGMFESPPGSPVPAPAAGGPSQQEDQQGSCVDVSAEIVEIWLPKALYDLVHDHPDSLAVRSGAELRSRLHLKGEGSEKVWLAFRVVHHMRNGETTNIRHFQYPCEESGDSSKQCLDLLETAAGKPLDHDLTGFSTVRIGILPEGLLKRDSRDVLDVLMPPLPGRPGDEGQAQRRWEPDTFTA